MRIPINGDSMYPVIRRNRDMVTIFPITRPCEVGDIVLFSDPNVEHRYVLHRLWKIDGDRVLTWGDNCFGPDRWMSRDRLWGIAVCIERDQKAIHPDRKKGMILARYMHSKLRFRSKVVSPASKYYHQLRKALRLEKQRDDQKANNK